MHLEPVQQGSCNGGGAREQERRQSGIEGPIGNDMRQSPQGAQNDGHHVSFPARRKLPGRVIFTVAQVVGKGSSDLTGTGADLCGERETEHPPAAVLRKGRADRRKLADRDCREVLEAPHRGRFAAYRHQVASRREAMRHFVR